VVIGDVDPEAVAQATEVSGAAGAALDATDSVAVGAFLDGVALAVSAVPYPLGVEVARAAVDAGTHYLDFGGNPTIVRHQLALDGAARRAGVAVVPDCGLAPGMANVLAVGAVDALGPGPVDEVRLRVGALPAVPTGTLGYQLAFNPAGLVNEYDEPCEVLVNGKFTTIDPLTEVEDVDWPEWGPLEAFHTAGGSSSLPRMWEGRVSKLDYKTLRYPGHGHSVRAMREIGLFSEEPQPGTGIAPRAVLLEALRERLPSGADDVVLVRVWASVERDGERRTVGYQVDDRHDGRFSALARTTAFPATALADLLLTGEVETRGAVTMDGALPASLMVRELEPVGVEVADWP
jgi:lysine 6-dehydrogenase